jgi:hypothetical protein
MPIIEKVLAETSGKDEKEIVKALRDAYPFGPRKHHPYKIWLDEVKRQRGGSGVICDDQRLVEWERLYGKREA